MTITLPDTAIAAAIATIAGAVVWAIRVLAKAHIDVMNDQSKMAKTIAPLVAELLETSREVHNLIKAQDPQFIRLRRALKRLNPVAFVCDECIGWFGEPVECPEGMEMCRCSDPTVDRLGSAPVTNKTPPSGIPVTKSRRGRGSRPDKG